MTNIEKLRSQVRDLERQISKLEDAEMSAYGESLVGDYFQEGKTFLKVTAFNGQVCNCVCFAISNAQNYSGNGTGNLFNVWEETIHPISFSSSGRYKRITNKAFERAFRDFQDKQTRLQNLMIHDTKLVT